MREKINQRTKGKNKETAQTSVKVKTRKVPDELELYRAYFEHANDAIFVMKGYRFIDCNPKTLEMFGCTREQILETSPRWLSPPLQPNGRDSKEWVREKMDAAINGVPQLFEWKHCRYDGSTFDTEVSLNAIKKGTDSLILGIVRDISERKQAEEVLSHTNRSLQNIIDFLPDATFVIDNKKQVIAWNRAMEEMTGVSKADILGKGDYAYAVPLYKERKPILIDLIQSTDEKMPPQYDFVKRETNKIFAESYMPQVYGGKGAYVMLMASTLFDEDGNITGAIESVRDITIRKEGEKSLKDSETKYRRLYDSIMDAVVSVDLNHRITDFNESYRKMLGYERDELVGMTYTTLTPDRWHSMESEIMDKQLMLRGYSDTYEKEYIRSDGSIFPVEIRVFLLRDDNGHPASRWAIARDITERKRIDEDLRRTKEELEQRVAKRTDELKAANERLITRTRELEERQQVMSLLNQMGDFLQACKTMEESYTVIGQSLADIFPRYSGAMYIFSASRNLLDCVAYWGESPPEEKMFSPDDCWAIRRVRPHIVKNPQKGLRCLHTGNWRGPYMCIPMVAGGEVLGMLHIQADPSAQGNQNFLTEGEQQLIDNVSDQIGMAIANMRLHEKLRNLSVRDPLTGLFNRRFMEESLDRELSRARRCGSSIGVIMCDLDHFKTFNDTFGHEAGDVLLCELGGFFRDAVRASDIACRFGGEEFVLILPETTLESAVQRAECLRQKVKQLHVEFKMQSLGTVSLSLGVVSYPDHGLTGSELIRAADKALYKAKHEGRDRVFVMVKEPVESF